MAIASGALDRKKLGGNKTKRQEGFALSTNDAAEKGEQLNEENRKRRAKVRRCRRHPRSCERTRADACTHAHMSGKASSSQSVSRPGLSGRRSHPMLACRPEWSRPGLSAMG
jgi:hypothetical protein